MTGRPVSIAEGHSEFDMLRRDGNWGGNSFSAGVK
jgi:hypothetical protein